MSLRNVNARTLPRERSRAVLRARSVPGGMTCGAFVCVGWFCVLGLTSTAAQAQTQWAAERTLPGFEFRSDYDLSDDAELLSSLPVLRREITKTLKLETSDELFELYLFRNRTTYQRYVQPRIPVGASRRAFFAKAPGFPGRLFAFRQAHFETDVRHETTHAVLHAALPAVPIWLDEGLAVYFEVPEEQRAYGHPHLTALKSHIRAGWQPSLDKLEAKRTLTDMNEADYRDSWAAVHWLLHGSTKSRAVFDAHLKQLASHEPPGLISQALRREFADPEREIIRHILDWKAPGTRRATGP